VRVIKFILVLLMLWSAPGFAFLSNVGPELSISGKVINNTSFSLSNITLEDDLYSDGNAKIDYAGSGRIGQYNVDLIRGDQFLTKFYVMGNDGPSYPYDRQQCQIRVIAYDSGQVVIKSFPNDNSYIHCEIDNSGNILLTDAETNNQLKK